VLRRAAASKSALSVTLRASVLAPMPYEVSGEALLIFSL
jgi:hypothetical protein